MQTQITPFRSHVILSLAKAKDKEKILDGIVIPGDSATHDSQAIVVAKGPEVGQTIATGDRVVIPRNHGTRMVIDGHEFVAMKAEDLVAKLSPAMGAIPVAMS